ncbi:Coronin-2B [Phytophthora boehmeriae]|uniref:Coronin n=1 Tax=Phytophthora boehmeriae TaxID=109152 RepID=A0A8T1X8U7_9STRA|nr:Coronin-2B [Phytophthora boehmeriae]
MAPRFQFRASKFRNVECKLLPREHSFDQLQVSPSVDGNVLACSSQSFAFAHHMDAGGAVQVKSLRQTGKETPSTPPLVRAHPTGRVTALAFSPFHEDLLFSAGDSHAAVKVWKLPSEPLTQDLRAPIVTFQQETGTVAGIVPHPSADAVVATYSRPGALRVYDIHAEKVSCEVLQNAGTLSSAAWNWDGSLMVVATQDQTVQLLDPRIGQTASPHINAAHTGKRHLSVIWCGRTQHFVTCGSDRMQERELKLWDPRQLSKCVHRERLDAGCVGQLFPLYDADLNLLYVLGKGDRSARLFEVDLARAPFVHALDHSALGSMTLAASLLPKQVCDTNVCEVARVLNLSTSGSSGGGCCEVVSYRVPRKEATHTFQADLYPDTLALKAAMTGDEWRLSHNAEPMVESIEPTSKITEGMGGIVFGRFTTGVPTGSAWSASTSNGGTGMSGGWQSSGWGKALSSTASSRVPSKVASDAKTGWGSSTRKWNEPEPRSHVVPSSSVQWNAPDPASSPSSASISARASAPSFAGIVAPTEEKNTPVESPAAGATAPANTDTTAINDVIQLSDKAQRLGAKYGHKLKYLQGKEALRNDLFHFGDKRISFSTQASPVIAANATFWAAPIAGTGGPVLVESLGATGKARHGAAPVLNGQKAEVTSLAFNPFNDHVLATGSADSTIQLWSLASHTATGFLDAQGEPKMTLLGHTKGLRALQFNPSAADVLCSTSQDLSLRFWDVETGQERLCIDSKLEDIAWNMAFSDNGALLATASRAKIMRVFDPRQSEHALVALGCGYESSKPQFLAWLDSDRLLTVGVNARNETQVSFWDARNLLEPLGEPVLVEPAASAASTTTPLPLYDPSSRLLFLVGTGTRHIWSYEVDPSAAALQANLPFMLAGTDTIGGVALLPKSLCNVRDVELAQVLVATPNIVERLSFSLPRAPKLKEFFQDDVIGPVRRQEATLNAAQWFSGGSGAPVYDSLVPDGMVPLSEKTKDSAPVRPKTLDFQAQLREEEERERQKTAQFARLSTLAAQPSLHSISHTGVKPPALQTMDDYSDDDWDD